MDAQPEPACGIEKSWGITKVKQLAQVHVVYQRQNQNWKFVLKLPSKALSAVFFSSKPGGFMQENSHGICRSLTQRLNMDLEIWLFLFFSLEANQLSEQTTRCYLEIKHISSLGLQRLTFVGDFIQMSHPIPCL